MRHLRLRLDDARLHLLRVGLHLLLLRDGHRAALLRLGLCDALVRLRLVRLQLRADVAPNIDIRDIDGEDLERRARIEALSKHRLADVVRIREHIVVALRRADRRHDALADARDDRRLARAAHEPVDIRAHRHARLDLELDAVLCDRRDDRCLDDLRIDAHLHRLQDVAPREVDGRAALERQRDLRAVRRDQRVDHLVDIAAREIMRLELVDLHVEPRLVRLDERQDDRRRRHAAHPHADERQDAHIHIRGQRGDPEPERHEMQKQQHREKD